MENLCTIYSHQLCYETLTHEIKNAFPGVNLNIEDREGTKVIKGNMVGDRKTFQISYRERENPSYQIVEVDSPLSQNFLGMAEYVDSITTSDDTLKSSLVQKILTLNSELAILTNGTMEDELKALALQVSQHIDGIAFCAAQTPMNPTDAQQFLNKNFQLILDTDGHSEVEALEVNINPKYFDPPKAEAGPGQLERKQRNEALLVTKGIKTNLNLPCIAAESDTTIRDSKEIAKRVVVLALTNLVAFKSIKGEEALNYLVQYEIMSWATPKEIEFLENPTEDRMLEESWKCEGIWVLLWAIGTVETLGFPNQLANLNDIPQELYPIGQDQSPQEYIDQVALLRPTNEILDANDLYYRMDWACVDARVNGEKITGIHPGVVYERHYALNWLINYRDQPWDEVSCDT